MRIPSPSVQSESQGDAYSASLSNFGICRLREERITPKEQAEVVLLVHGDSTANRPMGTIDAGTHLDAIPVDARRFYAGAHSVGREIRKLIDLVNRQPRPKVAERQRLRQAIRPGDNATQSDGTPPGR